MSVESAVLGARCWSCVPARSQFEVQTYILAVIAGQSTDPAVLTSLSRCLSCLTPKTLYDLKAYFFALQAGRSTEPSAMMDSAKCYLCQVPPGVYLDIQTYTLSLDPSGPGVTDPNLLLESAKAFQKVNPSVLLEIQVYLLAVLAGVSTEPNALVALVRCYNCLSHSEIMAITAEILDYAELDGGGGISGCVDVPADLIPVIEATYDANGTIDTLTTTLPKVCCDPHHITIYEADDTLGTGATAVASSLIDASHSAESNYTLPVYAFGATPSKSYIVVKQHCADGSESGYSNAVFVGCGLPTEAIYVDGAGDPDANGTYLFDQAEYDSSGRITYWNDATLWMIEFTDGGSGAEAFFYNEVLAIDYTLPLGECFPCGAWTCAPPNTGTCPPPVCRFATYGESDAADWASRVLDNGGAYPSAATIAAAAEFGNAVYAAGIQSKIKTLNIYAPDSLVAARTPLIIGSGSSLWTNVNFVAGDLTVNGLIGDGTKYLDTGVNPATAFASNNTGGISIYHLGPNAGTDVECGASDATGANCILFWAQFSGTTYWQCYSNAGGGVITYASPAFTGFISMNRTGAADTKIYDANSGSAFAQRATGAANAGSRPNVGTMVAHGYNNNTAKTASSKKRISFLAIHDGLTATEAEDLFDAVQSLRVALGGGFV